MQWAKQKQSGFTIIELLIVVVVIAILAAITIVAYNGIQDRAMNSSRISAAQSSYKLMMMYYAENGRYPELPDHPVTSSLRAACIGENWPQMQGQPVCWNVYTDNGELNNSTFLEVDSVNQALLRYGSLPQYPQAPVATVIHQSTGRPMELNALVLVERRETASPNANFPEGFSIAYILKGSVDRVDCGLSNAMKTAFTGGGLESATRCVIPLPSPVAS